MFDHFYIWLLCQSVHSTYLFVNLVPHLLSVLFDYFWCYYQNVNQFLNVHESRITMPLNIEQFRITYHRNWIVSTVLSQYNTGYFVCIHCSVRVTGHFGVKTLRYQTIAVPVPKCPETLRYWCRTGPDTSDPVPKSQETHWYWLFLDDKINRSTIVFT